MEEAMWTGKYWMDQLKMQRAGQNVSGHVRCEQQQVQWNEWMILLKWPWSGL